jgi:ubiquinone/menaquinone biosynthesis C-methylase UbiE
MADTDKVCAGSIPELYDEYLVPMIFESFAADLASRVAANDPMEVLEIAAGSGVVTRVLASKLSENARYVVSDLNQPMLDHAAKRQGADERITWQQADALSLPFADNSFDAIACQFGVMFFPDRIAGYREARRVLKPGGVFHFNIWDHIGVNEFADIVTQTASAIFPDDPPVFLARTPHGHHDKAIITEELRAAGFADFAITTREDVSTAATPEHAAIAYCQGTPLKNEIEARNADLLAHVTQKATEAITGQFGSGPVTAKICAHVIAATN